MSENPCTTEYWICGWCYHVAEMGEWRGDDSSATCPGCRETHYDDDTGCVYAAPTELEARRKARDLALEDA